MEREHVCYAEEYFQGQLEERRACFLIFRLGRERGCGRGCGRGPRRLTAALGCPGRGGHGEVRGG